MKRLYTLMLVLLCALSASADIEFFLVSDSIFEAAKYNWTEYERPDGSKITMLGNERYMVDDDGIILLNGKWQYIQITDKPFYLLTYDTETGQTDLLYAYDTYYDTEYDETTGSYVKSGDYWYGTYTPYGSRLEQIMTKDENGNDIDNWKSLHYQQPWVSLWFTYDNYNGDNTYYYFNMESGLYAVQAAFDGIGAGIVLSMYKLYDLFMPEDYKRYPQVIVYEGQKYNSSNVNVNVWYTYYTITGGKDQTSTKYVEKSSKFVTEENVIPSGEYAGYRYVRLYSNWSPNKWLSIRNVGGDFTYIVGVKDWGTLEPDAWYNYEKNRHECKYQVNLPSGSEVWAIWDVEGKRVKVLENTDFQNILSDASAIDSPAAVPYSTNYYSLDGRVVDNPKTGEIYIHNGKKVVYRSVLPWNK